MRSKFPATAGSPSFLAEDSSDRAAVGGGASPFSEELPPADTKRWVIRRKAVVVAAVRSGVLTLEEACQRYKLSIEEFLSWQRLIDSHGLAGLRVTRLQDYRGAKYRPS
jgi:Protein of unknown function (DUF1153)